MWSLAKFLILCLVAAAVGLAAVSVPIGPKTAAEYVRELVAAHAPKADPTPAAPASAPRPAPSRVAADRAPADDHSDDDRAALERLIQKRTR